MSERLENIEMAFKAGLIDAMRDPRDMWKPVDAFNEAMRLIDDLSDRVRELEDQINDVKEVEEVNEES